MNLTIVFYLLKLKFCEMKQKKRANLKTQKSKSTILALNTHSGLLHDAIFTKNTRFEGLVCFGGLNCSRLPNYAILQKIYKIVGG